MWWLGNQCRQWQKGSASNPIEFQSQSRKVFADVEATFGWPYKQQKVVHFDTNVPGVRCFFLLGCDLEIGFLLVLQFLFLFQSIIKLRGRAGSNKVSFTTFNNKSVPHYEMPGLTKKAFEGKWNRIDHLIPTNIKEKHWIPRVILFQSFLISPT